ncbi:unnamed protein product, partial [Polarella glacialis]
NFGCCVCIFSGRALLGAAAMALQSTPGSVFVLANSAPSAFRGSALATAATVGLAPAALADASAPSSVNFVGLAVVGATFGAAASMRRRGQKVAEKSGRAAVVARRAESIAATAIANGSFTILVKALQKVNLVEIMSGEIPYTVFAPTDAAFADLLKELNVTADQLLANPDLRGILLYHVAGTKAMESSLKDGLKLTTVNGEKLSVGKAKVGGTERWKVGRATITAADVVCSNGVIHIIDKVLLPPPPPFNPAKQVGAMAPLGYFDPAGFSKVGDKAGFNNLRASEIKHGRVERTLVEMEQEIHCQPAMLAALGAVFQHYVKFPGFGDVPSGLGAVEKLPGTFGFAVLFLVSGYLELVIWTQDEKKEPGNFGDPAGFNMYNPDMRAKEINNGRMAMFSAIGILAAEQLTGKDGMTQLGF